MEPKNFSTYQEYTPHTENLIVPTQTKNNNNFSVLLKLPLFRKLSIKMDRESNYTSLENTKCKIQESFKITDVQIITLQQY